MELALGDRVPTVAADAWVAPGAVLVGAVTLGAGASVWYGAVLRAEDGAVRVGAGSNIQDGCVLHTDPGLDLVVGTGVSVGHRAVLHGCTVGSDVLVGMGAIVMNGAVVGDGVMIGAGALVPPGMVVPPGSLAVGAPAKVRRELTAEEQALIALNAEHYAGLTARHRSALG